MHRNVNRIKKVITVLRIYPNPCSDLLYVNIEDINNSCCDISINDLTGRNVLSKHIEHFSNSERIRLTNLEAGVYLFKAKTIKGEVCGKFVKK